MKTSSTLHLPIARTVVGLCLAAALGMAVPAEDWVLPALAQAPAVSACTGAFSGTNAVVHFYLAIDQRQFAAAYACLTPWEATQLPFQRFKKAYAHTVAAHLVYADDKVPNGTPATRVQVDVHLINRIAGFLSMTSYQGVWNVNAQHLLTLPRLRMAYHVAENNIPPTLPAEVFTSRRFKIVRHLRVDLTGDGIPEDVYLTAQGKCKPCHVQQLWIYSLNRLVFQQELDDPQIIAWKNHLAMQVRTDTPGTPGIDTSHPTQRTYITWFWTQYGFVFHSRKDVTVP